MSPPARPPKRWLQRELLWRLMLPVLPLLLLGGLASALGAEYLVNQVFDRWLLDAARSLAREVHVEEGRAGLTLTGQARRMLVYDVVDKVYFAVQDGETTLAGTPELPRQGRNVHHYSGQAQAFDASLGGQAVRVVWVPVPAAGDGEADDGRRVGVAETLTKRAVARGQLLFIFAPLSVLLLLAAFAIARGVIRTVRPLEALALRWSARTHASLDSIDTSEVPKELMPFATALNDMLARVRGVLERERQFAATAAHQLRTPLTALQLGLARAAEAPTHEASRQALSELGAITQRTGRLLQQLLAIGQLDQQLADHAEFVAVDLNALARDVGSSFFEAAESQGVALELREAAVPTVIRGAPDLLSEALGNLVDNAIRHAARPGRVVIEVHPAPAALCVFDDGAGVPDDERDLVFERFVRGSGATGLGSGLGLAIVRDIAQLHQARVRLERSAWGGAAVWLSFPAA